MLLRSILYCSCLMPILSLGSESRGIQVEATGGGGGGGMNGQEDKKNDYEQFILFTTSPVFSTVILKIKEK